MKRGNQIVLLAGGGGRSEAGAPVTGADGASCDSVGAGATVSQSSPRGPATQSFTTSQPSSDIIQNQVNT